MFLRCCYGYAVSGMSVLVIGAVLPSIINEAGISFAAAGGLLSVMAIGNFLASLVFPATAAAVGKATAIVIVTALVPVCLTGLTFLPPLPVMYALILGAGIGKGSITILNNQVVNDTSENPARMLNYLHGSYAVGAFTAPFMTALFVGAGWGWKAFLYVLSVLCVSSCASYGTMDYKSAEAAAMQKAAETARTGSRTGTGIWTGASEKWAAKTNPKANAELSSLRGGTEPSPAAAGAAGGAGGYGAAAKPYLKSADFYCIAFALFFYAGFENCVNGWFVTYLQSTGVMGAAFAASLVSVTWAVILVGRLFCAALSRKYKRSRIIVFNCAGSAAFFVLLICAGSLPLITVSLVGLGFCMAGIYPTSVADAGRFIHGSTTGMSVLTAIAGLGGIIAPQVVGTVADRVGIVQAVSFLMVNAVMMVLLSAVNLRRSRRQSGGTARKTGA